MSLQISNKTAREKDYSSDAMDSFIRIVLIISKWIEPLRKLNCNLFPKSSSYATFSGSVQL